MRCVLNEIVVLVPTVHRCVLHTWDSVWVIERVLARLHGHQVKGLLLLEVLLHREQLEDGLSQFVNLMDVPILLPPLFLYPFDYAGFW